jgi:hypothetical protein
MKTQLEPTYLEFTGIEPTNAIFQFEFRKNALLLPNFGPIVQWIEFQIPVLKIWVRIPMGSQKAR